MTTKNHGETTPTHEKWGERYEKTLKRAILRVGDNCPAAQYLAESAKEFISSLLSEERKQWKEEVVSRLETLKADPLPDATNTAGWGYEIGLSKAISEIEKI